MKYVSIILLSLFAISSTSQTTLPIYNDIKIVEKYDVSANNNGVFLSSEFAKPKLDKLSIDMKGKKISKVIYLYSKNNKYPEFAQDELSDQRYNNLINLYPELKAENIQWTTYVQVGCGEINCSKKLDHGFIIEFQEEVKVIDKTPAINHENIDDQSFMVGPDGRIITGKDGTVVEFPENAFVDENGNDINDKVNVKLKEAIKMEDMVLGGLTTMTTDGNPLQTKGMLRVTAFYKGKPVYLKKGKSLKVSVPTGFDNTYSYYEGEEHEHQVGWNRRSGVHIYTLNEEKYEQFGTKDNHKNRYNETFSYVAKVETKSNRDFLTHITVHTKKGETTFYRYNYKLSLGRKAGLTWRQAKTVRHWFSRSNVYANDLQSTRGRGKKRYTPNIMFKVTVTTRDGRKRYDPDLMNSFSMNSLGWANVDKLAKFLDKDSRPFVAVQKDGEQMDNFTISFIAPSRGVILDGHLNEDGNYSFLSGEKENTMCPTGAMPAYVLAHGKKDGQIYLGIQKVQVEYNPVVDMAMEPVSKGEMEEIIRNTF